MHVTLLAVWFKSTWAIAVINEKPAAVECVLDIPIWQTPWLVCPEHSRTSHFMAMGLPGNSLLLLP